MNPVHFDAPGATIVFNALYDERDPAVLGQDISLLRLADGTYVDIGWYPQFDPSGSFEVTHYRDDWDHILEVIRTRSVDEVIDAINRLARTADVRAGRW